jgi:four helix bundle protein
MGGMMNSAGYHSLDTHQEAHRIAVALHAVRLTLPSFEMYEEGKQRRRSLKSVSSQIVEGYCLRGYHKEFLLHLHRAFATNEETLEHWRHPFETHSMRDESLFLLVQGERERQGKKLFRFIESVIKNHESNVK